VPAAVPSLVGLSFLVGFSLWRGRPVVALAAAVAAFTFVQVAVVRPSAVHRLSNAIDRVAHGVGVVLSVVVLGVTWLVVIVPVALFNRVLGIDLLDRGSGGQWGPMDGDHERPRRPFHGEPPWSGHRGRRVLRVAAVLVPVVLLGVAVIHRANTVTPSPLTPFGARASGEPSAVATGVIHRDHWATYHGTVVSRHQFPGEPWGAEVLAIDNQVPACDAVRVDAMELPTQDLSTPYVNVVDGRRRTLEVRDPERTVWMFGGSTTYGTGQRDEHTIASDLVRLARSDGVRLRVLNFGCPGKVNWAETLQFEHLLRSGRRPPDAAIFFDGINEWYRAFTREEIGLLDPTIPWAGYASAADQRALEAAARERGYVAEHRPERAVRLAAVQYRQGVRRARAVGAEFGVPVITFWQPALFTMPLSAPGSATVYHNEDIDPGSASTTGRLYQDAMARSGVDPIDLTDVLDDADQALFFDCCHTNEAGALLQAEAMYPFVEDALFVGTAPAP
jgi:hypothetical protein